MNVEQLSLKQINFLVLHIEGKIAQEITYKDWEPTTDVLAAFDPSFIVWVMKKDWIGAERPSSGQEAPSWRAITEYKGKRQQHCAYGPVAQYAEDMELAVLRCKVMSYFDEEIPDEIFQA